jgi:uncharacterized protein YndB with AHSA1/START domain
MCQTRTHAHTLTHSKEKKKETHTTAHEPFDVFEKQFRFVFCIFSIFELTAFPTKTGGREKKTHCCSIGSNFPPERRKHTHKTIAIKKFVFPFLFSQFF